MLKALLAEDDDIFARYVQRCVDWETIKTELAGRARTGDEALELAEKLRPDIIIMDVELPGPSGLDCIARLRESRQSCEILLVTGHDEFEYAQSGAKYGVTDILLKPHAAAGPGTGAGERGERALGEADIRRRHERLHGFRGTHGAGAAGRGGRGAVGPRPGCRP